MSAVWEWVRNVTLVIILLSFAEILLPGGNMRGCMKFVFALCLLAVIVSPLSGLVRGGELAASGYVPVTEGAADREENPGERDHPGDAEEQGGPSGPVEAPGKPAGSGETPGASGLAMVQTKQIGEVYREKLTAQLISGLKEKFPGISVVSAEIYINNEVRSGGYQTPREVRITIRDPDLENAVREYAAELLQIEKRRVVIALPEE